MARPLNLRLRLWILGVLVGSLALTGLAPARQAYYQRKSIKEEEARLQALEKKNSELESRLARLQDPAYMEKLAREQLGVVRPGETSYVVVPRPAPAAATPPKQDDKSWWRQARRWLSNLVS
jgi:cell division protein FtsB